MPVDFFSAGYDMNLRKSKGYVPCQKFYALTREKYTKRHRAKIDFKLSILAYLNATQNPIFYILGLTEDEGRVELL